MSRVHVQMDERSHDQMNCARWHNQPNESVPRRPSVKALERKTQMLKIGAAYALLGLAAFWIAYGLGIILGHLFWGWL